MMVRWIGLHCFVLVRMLEGRLGMQHACSHVVILYRAIISAPAQVLSAVATAWVMGV
jgi:hypothetical protein